MAYTVDLRKKLLYYWWKESVFVVCIYERINGEGDEAVEDSKIIELYNSRDEKAIIQTDVKYGIRCRAIANNILKNHEDTEECINDAYLKVWESIPPALPLSLSAYLYRITRNLALDRYRSKNRVERGKGEVELCIDELLFCQTDKETEYEAIELSEILNRFLRTLSERDRDIFVARYYFVYPVPEIASKLNMRENYVWNILSRTVKKLRQHLEKEGYMI